MDDKILILDDDLETLENLKEILAGENFEILTSNNPVESLEVAKKCKLSLILIDYLMPQMDGIDFIGELRKNDSQVRIIMMTAYSSIETAITAMKKGANDFISKPFKKADLMLKINKALQELNFLTCTNLNDNIDELFASISNKTRREVLILLSRSSEMRFMDIVRSLEIDDHTKLNFHIKNLLNNGLLSHKGQTYKITGKGVKMLSCLKHIAI